MTSQRTAKADGKVLMVGIKASRKANATRKNGGKKAKPAQIAAHVPAAGNAAVPAMVS